jgi:hypothetical protein
MNNGFATEKNMPDWTIDIENISILLKGEKNPIIKVYTSVIRWFSDDITEGLSIRVQFVRKFHTETSQSFHYTDFTLAVQNLIDASVEIAPFDHISPSYLLTVYTGE